MDDLSPETYDDLVEELAAEATERAQSAPRSDAVWDAVGEVVPEFTSEICRRVLELAEHEPDAELVDVVAEERHSDDVERLRAEAVTALVRDVEARVPVENDE